MMIEIESYMGHVEAAQKHGKDAVQLFQELLQTTPNDKELLHELAQLYNNLGFAYRVANQWTEAIHWYNKALELKTDDEKGRARTLNNLGYIHFLMGDLVAAKTCVGLALKIRESLSIPYELGLGYNTLGMIIEHEGHIDDAIDLYKKAEQEFEQARSRRGRALVLLNRGRLHRKMGDFDQALSILQEARVIFSDFNDSHYLAEVETELGHVEHARTANTRPTTGGGRDDARQKGS